MTRITGAYIRSLVRELDETLSEDDPAFLAACVHLAGLNVGPNIEAVALLLGVQPGGIEQFAARLQENRIWHEGRVHTACIDEDDAFDSAAFWAEVLMAVGFLRYARERSVLPKKHSGFVHPENPELTWCGRGRRPFWLKELLAEGVELEEL